MSSSKIDGDVAVSRNAEIGGSVAVGRGAAIGGDGKVVGSLSVGHNLAVKGWLEARNIKGTNKGLFASESALQEAYPDPEAGWYALVGDTADKTSTSGTFAATVYVVTAGSWASTGKTCDLSVNDLNGLRAEFEQQVENATFDGTDAYNQLVSDIAACNKAISNETTTRKSEDTKIKNSIEALKNDSIEALSQEHEADILRIQLVEFAGMVYLDSVTASAQGTSMSASSAGCSVVFDQNQQRFLLRSVPTSATTISASDVKYYGTWNDNAKYLQEPRSGKLYLDTTDNTLYRWDSLENTMVRVGGVSASEDDSDTSSTSSSTGSSWSGFSMIRINANEYLGQRAPFNSEAEMLARVANMAKIRGETVLLNTPGLVVEGLLSRLRNVVRNGKLVQQTVAEWVAFQRIINYTDLGSSNFASTSEWGECRAKDFAVIDYKLNRLDQTIISNNADTETKILDLQYQVKSLATQSSTSKSTKVPPGGSSKRVIVGKNAKKGHPDYPQSWNKYLRPIYFTDVCGTIVKFGNTVYDKERNNGGIEWIEATYINNGNIRLKDYAVVWFNWDNDRWECRPVTADDQLDQRLPPPTNEDIQLCLNYLRHGIGSEGYYNLCSDRYKNNNIEVRTRNYNKRHELRFQKKRKGLGEIRRSKKIKIFMARRKYCFGNALRSSEWVRFFVRGLMVKRI
jgi:hypothetical protein